MKNGLRKGIVTNMIRINQIKLPIEHEKSALTGKIVRALKISKEQIKEYEIVKKSIDARKKPELSLVYSVNVTVEHEEKVLKHLHDRNVTPIIPKEYQILKINYETTEPVRPVIVGAGPAGLFCAYALVLAGLKPLVLERGKKVEDRTKDVLKFWETGVIDPSSNVQFGEGGAGTFSDGKLNTLVKDPIGRNRFVLETFVKFGAPEKILYENKPHIGTDILSVVIANMRNFMMEHGAMFRFETCVTDFRFEQGCLRALELNHAEWIDATTCVLAIGHSARDTFEVLHRHQFEMEAKSFAVGFRVEHPQEMMNKTQYGNLYWDKLPAAPYKVTANLENGRGVYSFCMCPGGYVVNASSMEGHLAVNGMSYSDRSSKNANSAIIVSVTPDDFPGVGPLSGVAFQMELEKKAYELCKGKIPQQLFGDYCKNQASTSYGAFSSMTRGEHAFCNLRGLLSEEMETSFIEGMHHFSKAIKDFDREDAILSGIESRTSSPVRITRDANFMANYKGVYPCGEGAGYAGGITSAAMDGLKVAEAIRKNEQERQ